MTPSHPDLARLNFLFGTWKGQGSGRYPTINPFEYLEEASFNPGPDKPFVTYRQRTRRVGNGEPLHSETGYIRTTDPDRIELVIAQPIGIVEIHTGEIDGSRIRFRSESVGLSPTAIEVSRVERRIEVTGDTMRYQLGMAAVGQPLQTHLEAELIRL